MLQQIEAWNRREADVGTFAVGTKAAVALTPCQSLDKQRDGDLTFIQDQVLGPLKLGCIRGGAHKRTANGHGKLVRGGLLDQLRQILLLHDHGRGHHQLGPLPVVLAHRMDVAVNQPQLPGVRQEHLAVHQFERAMHAPVGLGEARIEQQNAHGDAGLPAAL